MSDQSIPDALDELAEKMLVPGAWVVDRSTLSDSTVLRGEVGRASMLLNAAAAQLRERSKVYVLTCEGDSRAFSTEGALEVELQSLVDRGARFTVQVVVIDSQ